MRETYHLKIVSPVVINGAIQKADTIVELNDKRMAINLLERGKVVLATAADTKEAERDAGSADDLGVMLYGSSVLPSLIEIGGKDVQLGTVVAAAHLASGLSAEDWNALDEPAREHLLAEQVEAMKAEAAKAAANPPAAKKAAKNANAGK